MLEVILDTETTGLSIKEKHRIVEIGCIELENQIPTDNIFHEYINPQRKVSEDSFKIHGYSDEFLSDKKNFSQICDNFLNFIKNKKIIMHNAPFDLSFINYELKILKKPTIEMDNVLDTLELARSKFPGSSNSLDALCKRYKISTSERVKHNALLDCKLLKDVYINLNEQKEPKLNLDNSIYKDEKFSIDNTETKHHSLRIISPSKEEKIKHEEFLKTNIKKNFY